MDYIRIKPSGRVEAILDAEPIGPHDNGGLGELLKTICTTLNQVLEYQDAMPKEISDRVRDTASQILEMIK